MTAIHVASAYDAVALHQAEERAWVYQEAVREFHRWRDIFNVEFKLELSPTVFRVGGTRSGCYGHFRPSPNDFGLAREIAFDEYHLVDRLAKGEFWRALGTLLHELLHAWQYDHGKPGLRNYHNIQLRIKAAGLGLIMTPEGYTEYSAASPFRDLLDRHGVSTPGLKSPSNSPVTVNRRGSKLKKWSCGCTNVRVAVSDFQAQCLKCHRRFERAV